MADKLSKTAIITRLAPPAETALQPRNALLETDNPVSLLLRDKRSESTRKAYLGDLKAFLSGDVSSSAVRAFVTAPTPTIALRLGVWKAEMIEAGLAEATINRRLAAVRSLLKYCYRLGISTTDGRGLVDGERVQSYRDTRGITLPQMQRLIATAKGDGLKPARDRAILRILCENGLRRAELCALNVADFQMADRRLAVLGKGKGTQKTLVSLSRPVAEAIAHYLLIARHTDGALFTNVSRDPRQRGERLTPGGLYVLIQECGKKIGKPDLTPHKLRHSCLTAALDATSGDVRKVQRLSRHAKVETLLKYDDNRADFQGELTRKLAKLLGGQ